LQPTRVILLIGGGSPAALSLTRSLGRGGNTVVVLRLRRERTLADYSRYCARSEYIGNPDTGVASYLEGVRSLLTEGRYDYVIPTDHVAYALVHHEYSRIVALTRIVGPSPAAFDRIRDRSVVLEAATRSGFRVPRYRLVPRGRVPTDVSVPCAVSGRRVCAVVDDEIHTFPERPARNHAELDDRLREDLWRGDLLIRDLADGDGMDVQLVVAHGAVLAGTAARRLQDAGDTAETSYRATCDVDDAILAPASALARELDWTGFMTLSLRVRAGQVCLTGTDFVPNHVTSLATLAGMPVPGILIDGIEARNSSTGPRLRTGVRARVLFPDLRRRARQVSPAKPVRQWIEVLGVLGRAIVGRDRVDVESVSDPLPAIGQFVPLVRRAENTMLRRRADVVAAPGFSAIGATSIAKTRAVLLVCKGNINRSVVAEHLLRAAGFSRVSSAALLGRSGRRPSQAAEEFLQERLGIDTANILSRSIPRAVAALGCVDVVLCFERAQVDEIEYLFPAFRGRVMVLTHAASGLRKGQDVADPHGRSPAAYRECFETIETQVRLLAAKG
jgi:protein-tyrosine-phosphatase/predicted ATP-grasp superfamily ATP-dependent carboligase